MEDAASDALCPPLTIIQPKAGIDRPTKAEHFERVDAPALGEKSEEAARKRKTRHWCGFCRRLREHPDSDCAGNKRCMDFDFDLAARIWRGEHRAEGPYQCWAGFIDYSVPVRVGGHLVALCFSGQKRPGPDLKKIGDVVVCPFEDKVSDAARAVGLDERKMLELARGDDIEMISSEEEAHRHVDRFREQLVYHLGRIAHANYLARRQSAESYFRREIAGRFHTLGPGAGPRHMQGYVVDALRRVVEFFPMAQCLLLRSDIQYLDKHNVHAVWPNDRGSQRSPGHVNLQLEQRDRERLALTRLDVPARELTANTVRSQLGIEWEHSLWMASLPLPGDADAVVLFVDPIGHLCPIQAELPPLLLRSLRQSAVPLRSEVVAGLAMQSHLTRIGHTLELPMQAMVAEASAIVDDRDTPQPTREFAKSMLRHGKRLNCLAGSLRWGLTRHQRRREKPRSFDIGRLLDDVCDMFESEALGYGCTLQKPESRGGPFPRIEMWPDELEIAFHNLIDNAVKYSFRNRRDPSQYKISIHGYNMKIDEHGMRWYCVTIRNRGIGIAPEELESGLIFREGYRGRWAQDRNRAGSGIGSGVSKEIIERRHRGRLIIESKLPRGRGDRWPTAEEIASAMRSGIGGRRTLQPYITTATVELPYCQDYEKRE